MPLYAVPGRPQLGGAVKALIVRRPWIDAILTGDKTWEMRTGPTGYRGPLALIRQGTGLIVGVARLVDSLPSLDSDLLQGTRTLHRIPAELDGAVLARGWTHPWVLTGAHPLRRPVPAGQRRGQVTWVGMDKETVASVWAVLPPSLRQRLLDIGANA